MRPAERERWLWSAGRPSRRQRDPGGRGEGGSAALREARGRQRGSEGGPGTAARLGGRPGYGSAARWEARTETAARLGGRPGGGSAARWEARRRYGSESGSPVRSRRQCSVVTQRINEANCC